MSKPSASQTGKLRSYLAHLGIDPQVANEIVKMAKTRGQIAADLVQHLKQRQPKP